MPRSSSDRCRQPQDRRDRCASVIVGDETNSRLYWDLVDPGLVDAAETGYFEYEGAGTYMTFLSCSPESTKDNLNRIARLYSEVNERGVTNEELEQARNKVATRIVLRGERPMGRLNSLGSNWLFRGEYRSVADDLATLRAITLDDIEQLLGAFPLMQTTTVGVGPLTV